MVLFSTKIISLDSNTLLKLPKNCTNQPLKASKKKVILGKWPTWRTNSFLRMYFFNYNSLHVLSTLCSSSGETNCINTTSGNCHSVLVAVLCAGWKLYMFWAPRAHHQERQIVSIQPLITVTLCWWQLPEVVLIHFVSPDDEREVLETCKKINTWKGICASHWSFTKNHWMMHGQQNGERKKKCI